MLFTEQFKVAALPLALITATCSGTGRNTNPFWQPSRARLMPLIWTSAAPWPSPRTCGTRKLSNRP